MSILYPRTNECIEAILLGLDLKPEDRVLAIGGSGDQALAILGYVKKVKVVDSDPEQIAYIKFRVDMIKKGDSLTPTYPQTRDNMMYMKQTYFDSEHNTKTVRNKIDCLEVAEPSDIISVAKNENWFTKLYLSNALAFRKKLPPRKIRELLNTVSSNLPSGGLIYLPNHDQLCSDFKPGRDYDNPIAPKGMLPKNLELESKLTALARKKERYGWLPAVYKKVKAK